MRDYRVIQVNPDPGEDPSAAFGFFDLGIHHAHDAEGACELGFAAAGISLGGRKGNGVAVPVNNWSECEVEEEQRPPFKAKRIGTGNGDGEPE